MCGRRRSRRQLQNLAQRGQPPLPLAVCWEAPPQSDPQNVKLISKPLRHQHSQLQAPGHHSSTENLALGACHQQNCLGTTVAFWKRCREQSRRTCCLSPHSNTTAATVHLPFPVKAARFLHPHLRSLQPWLALPPSRSPSFALPASFLPCKHKVRPD